jgi:hypothetical protein
MPARGPRSTPAAGSQRRSTGSRPFTPFTLYVAIFIEADPLALLLEWPTHLSC